MKNPKDAKSKEGELLRKRAMEKRLNLIEQQKKRISNALNAESSKSNRIVFDNESDEESDDNTPKTLSLFGDEDDDDSNQGNHSSFSENTTAFSLFNDDDDDDQDDFRIREQFQGEKGEKLLRLQRRFGGDSRFQLDERFTSGATGSQTSKDKEGDKGGRPKVKITEFEDTEENEDQDIILKDIEGNERVDAKERDTYFSVLDTMFPEDKRFIHSGVKAAVWSTHSNRYDPTRDTASSLELTKEEAIKQRRQYNMNRAGFEHEDDEDRFYSEETFQEEQEEQPDDKLAAKKKTEKKNVAADKQSKIRVRRVKPKVRAKASWNQVVASNDNKATPGGSTGGFSLSKVLNLQPASDSEDDNDQDDEQTQSGLKTSSTSASSSSSSSSSFLSSKWGKMGSKLGNRFQDSDSESEQESDSDGQTDKQDTTMIVRRQGTIRDGTGAQKPPFFPHLSMDDKQRWASTGCAFLRQSEYDEVVSHWQSKRRELTISYKRKHKAAKKRTRAKKRIKTD
eukprot:TRINITY_DN2807_c0_g1_i1.p1 TRINITY_DN2807_c0_g1~~TRINITY_DN2807_c0_g1_i1.p1  ORF type:complete len:509 (-),score=203.41 TRINITY_DN2807_c0_g1_i1:26-1552(-)